MVQKLFVVTTPIGNLEDITIRAKETLKNVDIIFCEDTRVTTKLLNLLEISIPKLVSINKFSEYKRINSKSFSDLIKNYENIALVSDAGVPGFSDPGMILVEYAHKNNIRVIPVSGICAMTTLISASGITAHEFFFLGFLPHTKSKKEKVLKDILTRNNTVAFYDSPLRIQDTVNILKGFNIEMKLVLGRELTKLHEEIIYTNISDIDPKSLKQKGEYTVLVQTKQKLKSEEEKMSKSLQKQLAESLEISTKEAYKILTDLKNKVKK